MSCSEKLCLFFSCQLRKRHHFSEHDNKYWALLILSQLQPLLISDSKAMHTTACHSLTKLLGEPRQNWSIFCTVWHVKAVQVFKQFQYFWHGPLEIRVLCKLFDGRKCYQDGQQFSHLSSKKNSHQRNWHNKKLNKFTKL